MQSVFTCIHRFDSAFRSLLKVTEKYTCYTMSGKEKASIVEKIRGILAEANVVSAIIFGSFIELDSFRDIDVDRYRYLYQE